MYALLTLGMVLSCCYLDNPAEWSGYRAKAELDTTNYQCSRGITGEFGSVRIIPAQTASPYYLIHYCQTPLDISGERLIACDYYVTETGDFDGITVYLVDGANNRVYYNLAWYPTSNNWKPQLEPGWHRMSRRLDKPSDGSSAFNFADVRQIVFRVICFDGSSYAQGFGDVTFDRIQFYTPQHTGARYALTWDDGFADNYSVAAYLNTRDLRGTFYVIPSLIDQPGYLTLQQLELMQQAGHLIANHTMHHLRYCELNGPQNLTVEQYIDEVEAAAQWLAEHGFVKGSRILAQPAGTGYVTDQAIWAVLLTHIDQMRLTGASVYQDKEDTTGSLLYASSFSGNPSLLLPDLQRAIDNQTFGVFYSHSLGIGSNRSTVLGFIDAVADARDAGEIEVVTMDRLFD